MIEILLAAQTIGLFVGVPLLLLYVKERVKNAARESTERVLADYKHANDQSLAALQARHQRDLQQFSLFTQRRNAVYGALYRRVRIASDAYGAMMGLTFGPDFSKYSREDAESYFARHTVPLSAQRPIISAFDKGDTSSVPRLLDDLDERVRRHSAGKAFLRAKNCEAVNELYLSDAVRTQMDRVRASIAAASVAVEREDGRDRDEIRRRDEMKVAVAELFALMRGELAEQSIAREAAV